MPAGNPFAGYADLESRWRPLAAGEQSRADVLLGVAARTIRHNFKDVDQRILAGELDEQIPVDVSCAMVRRAFQDADARAKAGTVQVDRVTVTRSAVAVSEDDVYLTGHDRSMLTPDSSTRAGVVPKGTFPAAVAWPR